MNPEYRTMNQSLPTLKKFLKDCPKEAADAFFAEELIPEELWKKVYHNYESVGELIQCLSGKVENYPGIFVKVLEVLVRMTGSETTVRTIKAKYAKCGGTRKLPRAPYEDPVSLPSGTPKRSSNEKPRPVVVTTTSHGSTGEQPTAHAKDLRSHTMAPSSSDKELDDVEGGNTGHHSKSPNSNSWCPGLLTVLTCAVLLTALCVPAYLYSNSTSPPGPTAGTERPATPKTAVPPASGCHEIEVKDIDKLYNYLYNDIDDWETLCSRLEVKKGKIATIRDSPQASRKLYSCLEAFVDLGEPDSCWEKVVSTVCGPPFIKKRLGKVIAIKELKLSVNELPSECA